MKLMGERRNKNIDKMYLIQIDSGYLHFVDKF